MSVENWLKIRRDENNDDNEIKHKYKYTSNNENINNDGKNNNDKIGNHTELW